MSMLVCSVRNLASRELDGPTPSFFGVEAPLDSTLQAADGHLAASPATLVLDGVSASEAANTMLAFLRSQEGASVLKVRPEKFWFSASVFQQVHGSPLHCVVKVRVFRLLDSGGQVVVELSRRRGDAVAFSRFAVQALGRLRALEAEHRATPVPSQANAGPTAEATNDNSNHCRAPPSLALAGIEGIASLASAESAHAVNRWELQPLLDLAANGTAKSTQAEALSALIGVIRGAQPATVAQVSGVMATTPGLAAALAAAGPDESRPLAATLAAELRRRGCQVPCALCATQPAAPEGLVRSVSA